MNQEFLGALTEIVKEKGISEEELLEVLDEAIIAAYKKIIQVKHKMLK